MPHDTWSYLIILGVMALVIRRALRSRTIKVESLWVIPLVIGAGAISVLAQSPPHELGSIVTLVLAILAGAAVGWQRGRLINITLDVQTGVLTSKASPAALVLILVLFAARFGLRTWMLENPGKGEAWVVATDALVLFGSATLIVSRLEMWLRCRKLMARAA